MTRAFQNTNAHIPEITNVKPSRVSKPLVKASFIAFGVAISMGVAATSCAAPPIDPPIFRVTNLGSFGGNFTVAQDINDLGQVVGYSRLPDNVSQRAFRTAPNAIIDPATSNLGTLGGAHSTADSINDLGQVVGASYLANNSTLHVFRTSPGAAINPATDDLGIGALAAGGGINNAGRVTGHAGNPIRAFRTAPNAAISQPSDFLGTLGGTESAGYAINNIGQVTGYSYTTGNNVDSARAIRVEANGVINAASNLGTLGGQWSKGVSINDLGQVVGESAVAGSPTYRAFRTAPNAAINPVTDDLGLLSGGLESRANDINNNGWVVGEASVGIGYHAFLFTEGPMMDLNDLLDASGVGWTLVRANAINDHSQIVGQGMFNGVVSAFRLDPVPEPTALLMAIIGLCFMLLRLRRSPLPFGVL